MRPVENLHFRGEFELDQGDLAMTFPQTRLTLIRKIAATGSERDWQEFLADYWGPVCRFASRFAGLSWADAEDIAGKTFEVLLTQRLLVKWQDKPEAKLRTLLCDVVRKVLANRERVAAGRKRLLREYVEQAPADGPLAVHSSADPTQQPIDVFYVAWVEETLLRCAEELQLELFQEGKGDYFRILYGRLCEDMSIPEIARALGLSLTTVENHYRAVKKRLAQKLEADVLSYTRRYSEHAESAAEFREEWRQLAEFLQAHGGLEQAIRQSYHLSPATRDAADHTASRVMAARQLSRFANEAPPEEGSTEARE